MYQHTKSTKLNEVLYDIRGPVLEQAEKLEEAGETIIKLNIGNPAPFGFQPSSNFINAIVQDIRKASGYCESQGLFEARQAIVRENSRLGIKSIEPSDIFIGNGVSELIVIAMQALLDNGDEILVPSPDYPLWTAAITLAGGKAVHYDCDETNDWQPCINDIESKISKHTKGIVIINPNNPTGAVYDELVLKNIAEIAHQNGLIVFADEIYSKILYDDAQHIPMAKVIESVTQETLCVSFNGLSKNFLAPGFRCGWITLHGNKERSSDYISGLKMLANMRLCSNVTSMLGVSSALSDPDSIGEMTKPDGRLDRQRKLAFETINEIDGLSCYNPKGAFYLFPKLDVRKFNINNDEKFVLDFLVAKRVLLVHGMAFNLSHHDHFRIVFLPNEADLKVSLNSLGDFLNNYTQT